MTAYASEDLTPSDLSTFTQGRLGEFDPNTKLALEGALQQIRHYCRWHVSPVAVETLTLDAPGDWGGLQVGLGGLHFASGSYMAGILRKTRAGSQDLWLPTKHLLKVQQVIENGVAIDVSSLEWSQDGLVRKSSGEPWTVNLRGLQVTFEHGYAAAQAVDWRRIVLNAADRMSLVRGLIGPFNAGIGPHKISAFYGTSRTGNMPADAGWLDDLTSMINTTRYVRTEI